MSQKDQQSVVPNPRVVPPRYVPQQTLQYKTFVKRAFTEALQNAFKLYGIKEAAPNQYDASLAKTKIGPDYQTTRANFPNIVIKFYEQQIKNAGVGHVEWGPETNVQILTGTGKITAGSAVLDELETTQDLFPGITELKGQGIPKGAIVIKREGEHAVLMSKTAFETNEVALTVRGELSLNEKFIEYHHSIYHGDIALEVYALSPIDRDKVADAIVEVVQMGTVGAEGKSFQERLYDTIGLTPYSNWHYIAVNTDILSGYGEREEMPPWAPEDQLLYRTEYRFGILGEFYSLTPKSLSGTLGLVRRVDVYPWNLTGISDEPSGEFGEIEPDEFPEGIVPDEFYRHYPPVIPDHRRAFDAPMGVRGSLSPVFIA